MLNTMPVVGPALAIGSRFLNTDPNGKPLQGTTSQMPQSELPQVTAPTPVTSATSPGGATFGEAAPTATPSAPATPESAGDPMDNFNLLMTGMLKGAQGLGTADFLARKRALERASIGRTAEVTPEDMRTLTPDQQSAIRSGRAAALEPEIDANAYELKKAEESIDNFFRVHESARKLGQEFAEKMVAPDSVIDNARKVIEANPDSLSTVLAGFNDKSKEKILGGLDYAKMGTGGTKKIVKIDGADYVQNADGTFSTPEVPTVASSAVENQLATAKAALKSAKELAHASGRGRSWLEGAAQGIVGSTDYTNLEAYANTLRTSVLSLATDPQVKKFFGPQMSNADVQLMTSAGTALNPELMGPEQFNSELTRLEELFNRLSNAAAGKGGTSGQERKQISDPENPGATIWVERNASGGWDEVTGGPTSMNRPQRNNNPLNIKASGVTTAYPGVSGIDPSPATDGGQFLVFESPQAGLDAAKRLITNPNYAGLSVDAALQRWSGGGYGGEVAPQFQNRTIASLTNSELNQLLGAMAKREGAYA